MKKPNRLLTGLIIISLGIHTPLIFYFADILKSKAFNYIELVLPDISKPVTRSIPRPRPRPKTRDIIHEVKKLRVSPSVRPVKQINMNPVNENYSLDLMEGISVPSVDSSITEGIGSYNVTDYLGNEVEFGTKKDYFEMVILKIESVKEYPDQARAMLKEGRITVGFTITMAGTVKDIKIIDPCRHEILNNAALNAVKKASPFPKPPKRFFSGAVLFEVIVVFETT